MHEKTLAELSQALQNKTLSSVELTQHYLKRIEQLDGSLNSYITVTAESALEQAAAADARARASTAAGGAQVPAFPYPIHTGRLRFSDRPSTASCNVRVAGQRVRQCVTVAGSGTVSGKADKSGGSQWEFHVLRRPAGSLW